MSKEWQEVHRAATATIRIAIDLIANERHREDVRELLSEVEAKARVAVAAQPAPGTEALLLRQRDAWKAIAEDQYAKLRVSLYGDGDSAYPVAGALDAYAAGKFPVLKIAAHSGKGTE